MPTPGTADPTFQDPILESLNMEDIASLEQWIAGGLQDMATSTIGSQGTTIPVTRSTPRFVTRNQRQGSGNVQTNLFEEPKVGIAEAVRQRIWERRARRKELVKGSASSLEKEEDLVVLNISSLEEESKGMTTPSQLEPDDDLKSSPPPVHRPVTHSTPKKSLSKPKCNAYKTKATKLDNSSRKRSRG